MADTNTILIPSLTFEEILSDGSTLTNPAADHRRLFLGEDGLFHLRDSSGAVTDVGGGTPSAHAASHENGGADEIDVTGLVGAGGGGASDPIFDAFGTPDTTFEFDTSSLTGLTTMGSPDLMDADTTIADHLIISDNDGTQTGCYAAVSAPFTAISKLTAGDARIGFQYVGMFCGIATPGKFVYMGIVNAGTPEIAMRTMTGPTDGSPGSPSMYRPPTLSQGIMPSYWAIRCASNTDISYYYSPNGVIWWPMLLNHNNTMTVGSVGFGVSQYAGSGTAAQGIWDYLRIWNSALTIPSLV